MKLKNQKGISLLEVLVSIIVFTLGILGLAPFVIMSIDGNSISRDVITASSIAQDYVESYKEQAALMPIPFDSTEANVLDGYTRRVVIIDDTVDSTLAPGCQQIDVTVSWNDVRGNNHSAIYSTLLYTGS